MYGYPVELDCLRKNICDHNEIIQMRLKSLSASADELIKVILEVIKKEVNIKLEQMAAAKELKQTLKANKYIHKVDNVLPDVDYTYRCGCSYCVSERNPIYTVVFEFFEGFEKIEIEVQEKSKLNLGQTKGCCFQSFDMVGQGRQVSGWLVISREECAMIIKRRWGQSKVFYLCTFPYCPFMWALSTVVEGVLTRQGVKYSTIPHVSGGAMDWKGPKGTPLFSLQREGYKRLSGVAPESIPKSTGCKVGQVLTSSLKASDEWLLQLGVVIRMQCSGPKKNVSSVVVLSMSLNNLPIRYDEIGRSTCVWGQIYCRSCKASVPKGLVRVKKALYPMAPLRLRKMLWREIFLQLSMAKLYTS
ncbi:hypothetical protein PHYBLDRAFT_171026 [Phycomyces blakesleeanus NRRL 1555(-)]|uniref:Uncharacterized protein n=1 Tax=Phycomyces blakesleeanus (strain ATCC 8743b / DSM 1359 / FGSC 10004 / NBRC 33097 / NRRL 1555) TaxID=763407 RepID=A0A162WUE3_PHYB8|nr:hypothetical protein PHYBLDRAFT_171026 [Phycomyces blakesleeanus NRRL 1555(-)]OAD70955.1 hypothetical protein PHYBLDRAFT_171026 [Phycomyces blakesleeanus NRRL 1555(-)]|eukprot:XP_018288995.1 hypothetical protein PHYBLDRAFT_171026 [Phycomyces blakesleeanus NRRL 1555(-)]